MTHRGFRAAENRQGSTVKTRKWTVAAAIFFMALGARGTSSAADSVPFEALEKEYAHQLRPLLSRYCLDCHSTEKMEGELDLERFAALLDVRKSPHTWQKVAEMLDNGEMPPKDAQQPAPAERKQIRGWVERYLNAEAHARAGDPGPVVLRRLSNAEYTYTLEDLTGVNLQPAREFPADGAAGEGFTNTGNALVMSPALLTKYLDAGKNVAKHAVLLPDGFRFSAGDTRRDWTDELLREIKAIYGRYADEQGRIPLEKYLAATLEERAALAAGEKAIEQVAAKRRLNARYLATIWNALTGDDASAVLNEIRTDWRHAKPADAAPLADRIRQWQKALSKFQNVGHMKSWVVPVSPVTASQEIQVKIPAPSSGNEVTLFLETDDAGDGSENDFVVWKNLRLVTPGRPDLPLRDVREFTRALAERRERVFASAAQCLDAAAVASTAKGAFDVAKFAREHKVDADALAAWLAYLGIGAQSEIRLDLFKEKMTNISNYAFVNGWGTAETPLLAANSTDQHVRIPGNMKGHGVVVHPSPTLFAAVGWRSPLAGAVSIEAKITHAHPECGNGVTWSIELRRGATRQKLATGVAQGGNPVLPQPIENLAVLPGDLLSLLIGPRDSNHACDLTDIEFTIHSSGDTAQEWSLTKDVSANVLSANPHPDRFGRFGIWSFYTEPVEGNSSGPVIPAGSLLARWQSARSNDERRQLAGDVQKLLTGGPPADGKHPDALLFRQLASLGGPLFAGARSETKKPDNQKPAQNSDNAEWGIDPTLFGKHPDGTLIGVENLCVQSRSSIAVRLPADLVVDSELRATAALHEPTGREGSAQVEVLVAKEPSRSILYADAPLLLSPGSKTQQRFERQFDEFRRDFPIALCYTQIVPVDEAVTLTLFHREDEPLMRLMLDDAERARLDRCWSELHFISQDALTIVDAFAQLMEYATQDNDPRLFEPFRKPINERAAAYKQELLDSEPKQVDALVEFASRAYRRPITRDEEAELRVLYKNLRKQELSHEEAFRLTLARLFVAPAFLYRLEKAGSGAEPVPVSDVELASRLSYFLWSSMPDAELTELAATGTLRDPDVLVAQARRMLKDAKTRRLATEFACQWLHIYEFDTLDEKSERHFPTFVALRGDMYEESIRFLTDMFQWDAPVWDFLNADYTFLNGSLAEHYGIPGVTGNEWRRVDGVRQYSRGGILGLASTLTKQSGASRTSPILRGNWIAEVVLGDKLPKPPKDVPQLPDDETETAGLTVRQLVEKHTSDPRCASCHARIDPFGYSLESFDAIGRHRNRDLANRPIDTRAKAPDGSEFDGIDGLRNYLLTTRREDFLKQFCRKLLGYALGREVQLSDKPLLDDMRTNLEKHDFRFFAAVETILRSRQFREIRGKNSELGEL